MFVIFIELSSWQIDSVITPFHTDGKGHDAKNRKYAIKCPFMRER